MPALVLALGLLASLGLNARFKDPRPAEGDSPAYLIAAHNLARHGLFSEQPDASASGVGREPAYAAFLAALMRMPTGLSTFEPSCLSDRARCPPATYRAAVWANLFFALVTAVVASWRLRDAALGLALAPGVFNLLFYPATSLNIPGYQFTAVPALALATAWVARQWARRSPPWAARLAAGRGRPEPAAPTAGDA